MRAALLPAKRRRLRRWIASVGDSVVTGRAFRNRSRTPGTHRQGQRPTHAKCTDSYGRFPQAVTGQPPFHVGSGWVFASPLPNGGCIEADLAAGTAHEPLQRFCNDDQMRHNERDQPRRTMSYQTPTSVEFALWPTDVDMDELWFGKLNFDVGAPLVTLIEASTSYSLPLSSAYHNHRLEADFVSIERGSVFRFTFEEVIAFRVLGENGLLELWDASSASSRPAKTTFRARGHAWTRESVLVFMAQGSETRFSYFVATDEHCLEVVCHKEPKLTNMGPARVTTARPNDQ